MFFALLASIVICQNPPNIIDNTTWGQVNGQLSQVQATANYSHACGVNSNQDVLCSEIAAFSWYQLPHKMVQVTIADGQIFGVGVNGTIYYSKSFLLGETNWVKVPAKSKATKISFDGTAVCHTSLTDKTYCANENISTSPNWFQVWGAAKEVVVFGQLLFGIDSADNIYASPSVQHPAWTKMDGSLKQIQYDGVYLCGVNAANDVYCAAQKDKNLIATDPQWSRVEGKFSSVSPGASGRLLGLDLKGNVFMGVVRFVQ